MVYGLFHIKRGLPKLGNPLFAGALGMSDNLVVKVHYALHSMKRQPKLRVSTAASGMSKLQVLIGRMWTR